MRKSIKRALCKGVVDAGKDGGSYTLARKRPQRKRPQRSVSGMKVSKRTVPSDISGMKVSKRTVPNDIPNDIEEKIQNE